MDKQFGYTGSSFAEKIVTGLAVAVVITGFAAGGLARSTNMALYVSFFSARSQ
jgi:hypothetical protein